MIQPLSSLRGVSLAEPSEFRCLPVVGNPKSFLIHRQLLLKYRTTELDRHLSWQRGFGADSCCGNSALGPAWEVPRLYIRPARVGDVPEIYELIRTFAD